MKRIASLLLMGALALGSAVLTVHAEYVESTPTPKPTSNATPKVRNKGTANLSERKDKVMALCEAVDKKLKTRVTENRRLEKAHEAQYAQLKSRLEELIARAKEAGYDVTDLATQLGVLKAKVTKFKTDKEAYVAALAVAHTYSCGKSEGEFKEAIEAARAKLQVVHADVKDIHTYVKETIKPAVRELKQAVAATATPAT